MKQLKQAIGTISEELKTITRKDWIIVISITAGWVGMMMMCYLITRGS